MPHTNGASFVFSNLLDSLVTAAPFVLSTFLAGFYDGTNTVVHRQQVLQAGLQVLCVVVIEPIKMEV